VASIILKWIKFGTNKTLPRPGHPATLSNRGRGALIRKATEFHCGDERTFQRDNHLCSTPPDQAFMVELPDGSHSSVKGVAWNQEPTWNQEETWHHPYCEAWWWQHRALGMFFTGSDRETNQDRGKYYVNQVQRDP
jgi:hypothetical protein